MFLHADSEDTGQTGRMPRLIWVFTGHTGHCVGFVTPWLSYVNFSLPATAVNRYDFDTLKLQTEKLKINNLFEVERWRTPAYMHKLFNVNSRAAQISAPRKPTVGFENFHFQNWIHVIRFIKHIRICNLIVKM